MIECLLILIVILGVSFLIAPVLSLFLGPSPDSPELAVYSWYDNQTTDWINTNYNTHMISYSFFVLMMAFLFLLITATCIEKYTSFKALVIWAWAIWFLLGCLTLFIMACYGLNQGRLMNSVYNEKMLFEEMTKTFTEFESLPGNKTNHTWVLLLCIGRLFSQTGSRDQGVPQPFL